VAESPVMSYLDVLPRFAQCRRSDGYARDAVSSSQTGVGCSASDRLSDRAYISFGQNREWMSFSGLHPIRRTPASRHIPAIVSMRSQLEVSRITARRVVTCMANKQTARNGGVMRQFPGNAMRTFMPPQPREVSVAILGFAHHPWPAFVRSIASHMSPKRLLLQVVARLPQDEAFSATHCSLNTSTYLESGATYRTGHLFAPWLISTYEVAETFSGRRIADNWLSASLARARDFWFSVESPRLGVA
jgi:hypothetical protein